MYIIYLKYHSLLGDFQEICMNEGYPLHQKAIKEINKRIQDNKAKLNLTGCEISDDQVMILVSCMSHHPALMKLELSSNNISDIGAECLLNFLYDQFRSLSFFLVLD